MAASGSNFFSIGKGDGTEVNDQQVVGVAQTFGHMKCHFNAATTATLTLRDNAANTALTCAASASTTCTGAASVTLAVGDLIDLATGTDNVATTCVIYP